MFRIDDAINTWRQRYLKDGVFTEEDVIELECHLIDIIDAKLEMGMEPEEAFRAAVKTLGDHGLLKSEYKKTLPVRVKIFNASRLTYIGFTVIVFLYSLFFFDPALIFSRFPNAILNKSWGIQDILLWTGGKLLPCLIVLITISFIERKALRIVCLGSFILLAPRLLLTGHEGHLLFQQIDAIGPFCPYQATFVILVMSLWLKGDQLRRGVYVIAIVFFLINLFNIQPAIEMFLEANAWFTVEKVVRGIFWDSALAILLGSIISRPFSRTDPSRSMGRYLINRLTRT